MQVIHSEIMYSLNKAVCPFCCQGDDGHSRNVLVKPGYHLVDAKLAFAVPPTVLVRDSCVEEHIGNNQGPASAVAVLLELLLDNADVVDKTAFGIVSLSGTKLGAGNSMGKLLALKRKLLIEQMKPLTKRASQFADLCRRMRI